MPLYPLFLTHVPSVAYSSANKGCIFLPMPHARCITWPCRMPLPFPNQKPWVRLFSKKRGLAGGAFYQPVSVWFLFIDPFKGMTNGQQKCEMKSKVKVKPHSSMTAETITAGLAHSLVLRAEASGCLCTVLSSSIRTHVPHGKLCSCLHVSGS